MRLPTDLQRLIVWWEEELVQELPLSVGPGPVADVSALAALDICPSHATITTVYSFKLLIVLRWSPVSG